jgi:hypothetical protein
MLEVVEKKLDLMNPADLTQGDWRRTDATGLRTINLRQNCRNLPEEISVSQKRLIRQPRYAL